MGEFDEKAFRKLATKLRDSLDVYERSFCEGESALQSTAVPGNLTEIKHRIIDGCGQMQVLLGNPLWTLMSLSTSYTITTCMSVMLDLDVANKIPTNGEIQLEKLSKELGVDQEFLRRVLRVLTGAHILTEAGHDSFSHTNLSMLMKDRNVRDLLVNNVTLGFRAASYATETWKHYNYHDLESSKAIPFRRAFHSSYYDYLFKLNPQLGTEFHRAMEALTGVAVRDIAFRYPFHDSLQHIGNSEEPPVMVDVGGGRGQVVDRINQRLQTANVRFIVQDLHYDEELPGLYYQRHDFFNPQPVKGAHIYFLRHILHDFGDSDCITILNRIAQAMVRGKSKLIICEAIVPDVQSPLALSEFDLLMGVLFMGCERTKDQFVGLIERVRPSMALQHVTTDDPIRESFLEVTLC